MISGESDGYSYNYDFCILEVESMGLDKNSPKDVVCLPKQGEHVTPSSQLRAPVKGRVQNNSKTFMTLIET